MNKFLTLLMVLLLLAPATVMAATIDELQEQLDELSDRLERAERHVAVDRVTFTGDLRTKADSIYYDDVTVNQGFLVDFDNSFDTLSAPFNAGTPMAGITAGDIGAANTLIGALSADPNAAALAAAMQQNPGLVPAFAAYLAFPSGSLGQGMFPAPSNSQFDEKNEILYTTRLRLNMKAKVADNINFSGRLNMYKNWGDSTGSQVMDSFNSFTMDGTNGGNTTGDWLRVERAMFVWTDIADSNFYLSIGRRPSTYGAPTNYRENEQRGGTPMGNMVNFDFDGVTIGYKLSKITDVEGQTLRFCYGQGFEAEHGNGSLFSRADLEDTQLGGFNFDLWNDDDSWLQMILFGAIGVPDSFKGVVVMPFADTNGDGIPSGMNNGGYVSRFQGQENIGELILGGVGYGKTFMNEATVFGTLGWTRAIGNDNFNSMGLGGLLSDAAPVMEVTGITTDLQGNPNIALEHTGAYVKDGVGETRDGYSIYVGTQIPVPGGKLGLEYNYGSEYWTPFTQAQDDITGSKLAARGHVGEAYYIYDITPKAFIKVGALYYDYEYTGSGSPVGKPQKVSDVQAGTAYSMFPVLDKVWDMNASMTVKF